MKQILILGFVLLALFNVNAQDFQPIDVPTEKISFSTFEQFSSNSIGGGFSFEHHLLGCKDIDTNNNNNVDMSDTIWDYDLSGIVDEKDVEVFLFFFGCSYTGGVNFPYVGVIEITGDLNLEEAYSEIQIFSGVFWAMNSTFGDSNSLSNGFVNMDYILDKGEGCNYTVRGSLWIQEEGILDIESCELFIDGDTGGQHEIDVSGELNLINSKIDSVSSAPYELRFNSGSKALVDNSVIIHTYDGVKIYSDDVVIQNSQIRSYEGIVVYSSKPTLRNLDIRGRWSWGGEVGLKVFNTELTVEDIRINDYPEFLEGWYGIIMSNAKINFISGSYNATIFPLAYFSGSTYDFTRQWKFKMSFAKRAKMGVDSYKIFDQDSKIVKFARLKPKNKEIVLTEFRSYLDGEPKIEEYSYVLKLYSRGRLVREVPLELNEDISLHFSDLSINSIRNSIY